MPGLPPLPLLTIAFEIAGLDAMMPEKDNIATAFEAGALLGAQYLQGLWTRVAQEMNVRGGRGNAIGYIQGIQAGGIVRVSGADASGDDASIVECVFEIVNVSPEAEYIENGHDAFHLPTAMSWNTPGVKRTKDGTPYVHVPFRHSAFVSAADRGDTGMTMHARRTMMPAEIHAQAKKLRFRQPQNVGPITNAQGQFVAADRYKWSSLNGPKRIHRDEVRPDTYRQDSMGDHEVFSERRGARVIENRAGKVFGTNPAWKTSKFEGLFKTGAKGHASYMTIRTITPNSPGWNIPAVAGKHIAARVAAFAQSDSALQDIVMSGIAGALGGES